MIKLKNISFDHCIKCTVCSVYCPVAKVSHFPGPKQAGPDTERMRIKNPELVDSSLKLCSNCKRCEIACPSNVKIADIIQEAKRKYLLKRWLRPRDLLLSRTDLMGKFATFINYIFNFITKSSVIKFIMDISIKIPFQKTLPSYENGTFKKYFNRNFRNQKKFPVQVIYFHGCFVNYNNHKLGIDLVTVLNAVNTGVMITREKCCGVPLIANGYIAKAKKNALFNIKSLSDKNAKPGTKIVSTSSSCTYALKNEYSNLLNLDNSAISNEIEYITKYINDQFELGNNFKMKPVPLRAAYHSPCHLERLGGVLYTVDLLKRIPELDLIILNSECCGIAGTYGFKKEYYNISQDIGKNLFRAIDDVNPEIVITDCETCSMQIEMNTQYKVLHPINILAMTLSGY